MKSKKKIKCLTIFLDNSEPMETDGTEFDNMDDFMFSLGLDRPTLPTIDVQYVDSQQLAAWRQERG